MYSLTMDRFFQSAGLLALRHQLPLKFIVHTNRVRGDLLTFSSVARMLGIALLLCQSSRHAVKMTTYAPYPYRRAHRHPSQRQDNAGRTLSEALRNR
jgi:hypothetical protein